MKMKNGAPIKDVIMPIGSSSGITIVLAITSLQQRKKAPINALKGMTSL